MDILYIVTSLLYYHLLPTAMSLFVMFWFSHNTGQPFL